MKSRSEPYGPALGLFVDSKHIIYDIDKVYQMRYNKLAEQANGLCGEVRAIPKIELYATADGKEVVAEFLESLPPKHQSKALKVMVQNTIKENLG